MIGVLVGLQAEARLLLPGVAVYCSGGRVERARQLAEQMVADGVEGLLSFGIAGGLDPLLRPGSLVVGTGVDLEGAVLTADEAWTRRLGNILPQALRGLVAGPEEAATTPEAKRHLRQSAGALAVDLESAAVAEAGVSAGRPFAILRAVADPFDRYVPPLALNGLNEDGTTRTWAVALGLLSQPWHLPGLIRLGLDSRAALDALGSAADLLGGSLGF